METFSALLAVCDRNSPVTGEFPSKRPVTWIYVSFICAWINGWINSPEAGDWRRYRAHYDVTVMWRIWLRHKKCRGRGNAEVSRFLQPSDHPHLFWKGSQSYDHFLMRWTQYPDQLCDPSEALMLACEWYQSFTAADLCHNREYNPLRKDPYWMAEGYHRLSRQGRRLY